MRLWIWLWNPKYDCFGLCVFVYVRVLNSYNISVSLFVPIWNSHSVVTSINVGFCHHFALASRSTLRGMMALLHYSHSECVSGPWQSQTMQATIIQYWWKRKDTKGENIFDIPGMAPRLWEGSCACVCMYSKCVCSYKWLLCSSDNATGPAEARGYEGERIMWLADALRHLKR